jgi:hypothetical protein
MNKILGTITAAALGLSMFSAAPAEAAVTGTDSKCRLTGDKDGHLMCAYESWAKRRGGGNWSQGTKLSFRKAYGTGLNTPCSVHVDYLIIEKPNGVNVGERHDFCIKVPNADHASHQYGSFVWPHNPDLPTGRASYYRVKLQYDINTHWQQDVNNQKISFTAGYGTN